MYSQFMMHGQKNIKFVMSVRPSVRMEQLGSPPDGFS